MSRQLPISAFWYIELSDVLVDCGFPKAALTKPEQEWDSVKPDRFVITTSVGNPRL